MNIVLTDTVTLGKRLRNTRLRMSWFGWFARAVGVAYLLWAILSQGFGGPDVALVVVGLFFLAFPEVLGSIVHLRSRKLGPNYTYTLTDEAMRVTTQVTTLEVRWAVMKSLQEKSTYWKGRFDGGITMTLAKDLFSPAQDAEWRAFLAERELSRAGDSEQPR
jgi:hypothetical protein